MKNLIFSQNDFLDIFAEDNDWKASNFELKRWFFNDNKMIY